MRSSGSFDSARCFASETSRSAQDHSRSLSRGNPVFVAVVLDQRNNSGDYCEPDERKQGRFVISRKKSDDVPAIHRAQSGHDGESNASSQGQRQDKFSARVLQRARRQQKRNNRKRWRQDGGHGHRKKSPALESLEHFLGRSR